MPLEAAITSSTKPSSRQLGDWLWNESSTGAAIQPCAGSWWTAPTIGEADRDDVSSTALRQRRAGKSPPSWDLAERRAHEERVTETGQFTPSIRITGRAEAGRRRRASVHPEKPSEFGSPGTHRRRSRRRRQVGGLCGPSSICRIAYLRRRRRPAPAGKHLSAGTLRSAAPAQCSRQG